MSKHSLAAKSPSATPFYGRKHELDLFEQELRDPRGGAILVIGHQGMGKTMLLERFMQCALDAPGLQCGAIFQELISSDTAEVILSEFMDRVHEAANVKEGSFDDTPRHRKQFKAVLNAIKSGSGDLIDSLRRDPKGNSRDQFLRAAERISEKLPESGRAVFIVDPYEYMPSGSAENWAVVVRRLPAKIKFVFAQRPNDALADSHEFSNLTNVIFIPSAHLAELDEAGYNQLIEERAAATRLTASALRNLLAPYERHPYAVGAAVDLLAAGVPPDELPNSKETTAFAEAQWKRIKRGGAAASDFGGVAGGTSAGGELAIRLFQTHAILEVSVPDDLMQQISGLTSAQHTALLADPFLGTLLRDDEEDSTARGRRRIYHATLANHIRSNIPAAESERLHRLSIDAYRERLKLTPPDGLAASRLALHVRAVDGDEAFVQCFVNGCTPPLVSLGLLDDVIGHTEEALETVKGSSVERAALLGNLGVIMRIRGDLDDAETMFLQSLEIEEKLGRQLGMASQQGNLAVVLQRRGDLDGAEAMCQKSLEIFEKLGAIEQSATIYGNLGNVLADRGDLAGAMAMYRKALEIDEELDQLEGMARHYGNLGNIMRIRGDLDGAEAMYRKALEINEKFGRLQGMAYQYGNLGILMEQKGDPAEARAMWMKARDAFAKLGATKEVEELQGWIDGLPGDAHQPEA